MAQIPGVRVTRRHLGDWSQNTVWTDFERLYSHLVYTLHPSESREYDQMMAPSTVGKKVIIIQCDGAACCIAEHCKQLREPKVCFSLLSKSWVILTWVLNNKRPIIRHFECGLESIKFSSPKHDRKSRVVLVKPSPIWDSGLNIIRQSSWKVNWVL